MLGRCRGTPGSARRSSTCTTTPRAGDRGRPVRGVRAERAVRAGVLRAGVRRVAADLRAARCGSTGSGRSSSARPAGGAVGDVARRWGFAHLGRFSAVVRRAVRGVPEADVAALTGHASGAARARCCGAPAGSVVIRTWSGPGSPRSIVSSMSTAAAPSSASGWATVVSGGVVVDGLRHVVEADHGQVLRHAETELCGGVQHTEGRRVVRGEHRGRAVGVVRSSRATAVAWSSW